MVATQNIDTLGLIWTFSLRGELIFVANSLDINGCVELFWGDSTFTLLYKLYILHNVLDIFMWQPWRIDTLLQCKLVSVQLV